MSMTFLTQSEDSPKKRAAKSSGLTAFQVSAGLVFLSIMASCASQRLEKPFYAAGSIESVLSYKRNIKSLKTVFSIELERDGNLLKGDAALSLGPESFDLQVYSLGVLVAEVSEDNGIIKSTPPADRNKLSLLIDGLRNSFFWWSINDPDIISDNDTYKLQNSWRMLEVSRKTMLPVKQAIGIENGGQLDISYGEPAYIDGNWFPSKIRIHLARYSAIISVRNLTFNPEHDR